MQNRLARALGYFISSLIVLKRILFTNIIQKLQKPHPIEALGFRAVSNEARIDFQW